MAEANPPSVKQEDFLALLKSYAPPKTGREKDTLDGRYRIQLNLPLGDLSSPFAKAYAVRDAEAPDSPLYALVFDNNAPLRQKNIAALKSFRHPHLLSLLAEGTVELSNPAETRYACVLERPVGQPLSQYLSQEAPAMSEATVVQVWLRPVTELLSAFNDMGISHNAINLRNVYIANEKLVVGECISQPSGFSQDPLFEPVERILASDWSKPDFAIGADGYAMAMVALHLLLGNQPFAKLDKETLIQEILAKSSFHLFAFPWELPTGLQDFFRGVIHDVNRDRWGIDSIKNWVAGRRFNIILPPAPRETSRGFDFAGQTYYTRRSLAYAMHRNWKEATKLLFDNTLVRWLDNNVQKTDVSDAIARVSGNANPDQVRGEKANNDILARVIMLLDPTGPVRLKHLSAFPEALGLLLARPFLGGKKEDLDVAVQIIDSDLIAFWIELQKTAADYTALAKKIQKARANIRKKGLGFGIERCLYDLLPSLPCLSPMLTRYRSGTLAELLSALDALAPQRAAQEDCIDTHIAAFVASKLDINKEVRLLELEIIPHMVSHPALIALKLFMLAQTKIRQPMLKGLSYWLAARLFPLLDNIHKRNRRRELQVELRDLSGQGTLQTLNDFFLNSNIFTNDMQHFQKTSEDYALRTAQINALKNNTYLARHSRMVGRGFAQSVAFSICFITVYFTLKSYFHF
jgi:hypothetical protein